MRGASSWLERSPFTRKRQVNTWNGKTASRSQAAVDIKKRQRQKRKDGCSSPQIPRARDGTRVPRASRALVDAQAVVNLLKVTIAKVRQASTTIHGIFTL